MIRGWLTAAAIGGFSSVAAGAVAVHLAPGDTHAAGLLRTGALYGMVHAAALVGVAAIADRTERPSLLLAIAAWSFAVGIFLFCFSLFVLGLTGSKWLAVFTPFGGTALMTGWVALGLSALRRR